MSVLDRVDRGAVVSGAGSAILLVVPITILTLLVGDSVPAVVTFLLVLVGFGIGGRHAAQRVTELPITNGAFAALVAFALVQAGVVLVALAAGRSVEVSAAGLALSALMATSAGMIGAMIGMPRASGRL